MRKLFITLSIGFILSFTSVKAADLVIAINTLECNNYYRSAALLTDLRKNFDIKFVFPEYESRIAEKYLNEKFNLHWTSYDITFNDSLYKSYRKNSTSECLYFPNDSKSPLLSFPLSQLDYSYGILQSIPGKIKVDTIAVNNDFLFSGDMSCAFDTDYIYILESQFGSLLRMNKTDNKQDIYQLASLFPYEKMKTEVLTESERNTSDSIRKMLTDPRTIISEAVSFTRISSYDNATYIRASIDYYKMGVENKIGIFTRKFIIKTIDLNFSASKIYTIPYIQGFYITYSPVFIKNDTILLSVGFNPSTQIPPDQKFLLAQYTVNGKELKYEGFEKKSVLPEEYSKLGFNYNFLSYFSFKNYFSFPYTKTIYTVKSSPFKIQLLPDIDTLQGSKIPEVKTNYMKLSFAVEYPITNFIAKFDGGKVKLFSYNYEHNLPFNQVELPISIKTEWPDEDFFAFISINAFVHINLRNQFIVKYYWQ